MTLLRTPKTREEIVSDVTEALHLEGQEGVLALLEDLHAGDVAEIIQYLKPHDRAELVKVLRPHLDPEILTFLDETVREEVIRLLNPQELAAAVADLESDDAFLVLEELDEAQQEAVLQSIAPEERQSFEESLSYPEDSAGRLMQKEVASLPGEWSVAQALRHVARNPDLPEVFSDLIVVDEACKPLGLVPLSTLLKSPARALLKDLVRPNLHLVSVDLDQEQVALLFRRYSLLSAPVVSEAGVLVGIITLDDVMDVMAEEAEEDIMHLGGIAASDFYSPVFLTSVARLQWLMVTFLNALLASAVISHFHMALEKKVALAVLMPIVAAMGGNAGMQVVTVTVRALSTQALGALNMGRTLGKAFAVSLLTGSAVAILLGMVATFWYGDHALGLILGVAMLLNMIWAGFAGTLLPIVVARMGMDPALSAGPLLTTTTDVLGFAIFLGLATVFLF